MTETPKEVEMLECIGGPCDGQRMSSIGFPDVQPWSPLGLYIRTPGRYVKPIMRHYRGDISDPLLDLLHDYWVWRALDEPNGAA